MTPLLRMFISEELEAKKSDPFWSCEYHYLIRKERA
jgi:hypothetical protein